MSEAIQYEVPAHLLQVTYEGKRLGEGSNLGEAVVVSTLFGKARVRIVHEGDKPAWLWPVAILVLLGIAAAVWWWLSASQPSRAGSNVMTPATPTAPAAGQAPRNIPELSNPVEAPAAEERPAQSSKQSPVQPQAHAQPRKQESVKTEKAVAVPQSLKKREAGKVFPDATPPAVKQSSAAGPKTKPAVTKVQQLAPPPKQEQPVAIQPSATPTALQPTIHITKHPVSDQNTGDSPTSAPPADNTQPAPPAAQP